MKNENINLSTQGQRIAARVLLIVWLLGICGLGNVLAAPGDNAQSSPTNTLRQQISDQDVIVVLGDMGSGKSTFMNFLAGCKLESVRPYSRRVQVVSNEASVAKNKTLPPIVHGPATGTIIPHVAEVEKGVYLVECPDLDKTKVRNDDIENDDIKAKSQRIANVVNINQALSNASSIRLVVMVNYNKVMLMKHERKPAQTQAQSLIRPLKDLLGDELMIQNNAQSILLGLSRTDRELQDENILQWWRDYITEIVDQTQHTPLACLSERLFVFNPFNPDTGWDQAGCLTALDELEKISDPSQILSVSSEDREEWDNLQTEIKQQLEDAKKQVARLSELASILEIQ